ncbi:thioredoxin [Ornithinimicrobium sp. Y1847]|uniref:thioredoxin n=1 Tax=unclassified Ornithinimicrobium TaxID=2615080 RepID=UPI003B68326E
MSTVNLTAETFEQTVTGNDIVLVDWWAEWCGPCKMFAPVYDKAADEHTDVVFGKVDTEDQQALAAGAQISSIPTIMAFREGILVFRQSGALPARDLESVITQVKALDMAEVRATMAANASEQGSDSTD